MSIPEIIKKLSLKKPEIGKKNLEKIFELFLKEIINSLQKKDSIELRAFGTFFVKEISAKKKARNPATNELIFVPKKNKLRFRASKRLKELINK